jgi:ABC-2 type transport system permease protein
MQRVFSQCVKELNQFRRDRLTVALAFLLPLVVVLIYGFGIRLEAKNIALGVQDLDNSFLSRTYTERLFATQQFIPTPLEDSDPTIALDRGEIKAVVIIPPDFARNLKSHKTVTVQALVDGTDVNNSRIIQNSLRATTRFFLRSTHFLPDQSPLKAHIRFWFNPGRKEALHIVPGIFGVILWVFPSMLAAISLVREKEQGTIVQVYASDLSTGEWLLGKALAYVIVAIGEAILATIVSMTLFGLRFRGDPSTLVVGLLVYLAAAVAFGLFVGSRASNQTAAVQGTAIVGFLTAILLSGFIYRLENVPFPISLLSNVIPARYFIEITRDVFVRGTGWPGIWHAPVIIGLIGLFFFRMAMNMAMD